jgi:hypothetical protein
VLNTLLSVTWYPLVMWFGCRMVRTGLVRWAVAAGISLCCMFLGGGMEIVLLTFASLLFLCLYPGILPPGDVENSPGLQRRFFFLALVFLIFLGLSMVQILPFLELYEQSHRYGGVTLKEATLWSLAPKDLIYFLLPSLYGPRTAGDLYWKFQNYLKTIYVGPVVFLLAGFYFVRQGKRSLALLSAMGLALVFALGNHAPLYPFFYRYFPLFSTLRYPVKFLFLFVFFLCVAAGLGLDIVRQRFSKNRHPPQWCQGLLIALVVSMGVLFWMARLNPEQTALIAQQWGLALSESNLQSLVLHNLNRVLAVATLTLIVFFFGMRNRLVRVGSPLLLILLILDLFLGNLGYALKLDAVTFHSKNNIIRTLQDDESLFRFYVRPEVKELKVPVNSREEAYQTRKQMLSVDLMMEHHLYDISGYNVPLQPRYERLLGLILSKPLTSTLPLLDMLNVKYVLTAESVDLKGMSWVLDGPETSKLYENEYSLPRAFLVKRFKVLSSGQEFYRAFHELTFDPQSTILLEKEPERFLELRKKPAMPNLGSTVRMITYENNKLVLEVNTPEAVFLFMSEAYYPGWKAYVDGSEEAILRANYLFRAIPVGPGSHRIEVVYEPLSFKVGLTVSLLTIFLLIAGWIIWIRLRRPRGKSIEH